MDLGLTLPWRQVRAGHNTEGSPLLTLGSGDIARDSNR